MVTTTHKVTQFLEGNVLIDQEGRQIRADKITIDQTQTFANAEGRVQMAQTWFTSAK